MFTKTEINAMTLDELKAAAIARKLVKPNTKAQITALKKKLEGYVGAVTETDKKNSGDNEKGFCPTIFSFAAVSIAHMYILLTTEPSSKIPLPFDP